MIGWQRMQIEQGSFRLAGQQLVRYTRVKDQKADGGFDLITLKYSCRNPVSNASVVKIYLT